MFPLENNDVSCIREVANKTISRICGFILYTRADAFVTKVLKDEDYWNALDTASGANWPIFAVRPLNRGSRTFSRATENPFCNFMCSKWTEPNENLKFLHFFEIPSTMELPCFIAFYINEHDKVEQVTIKIKGNTVEETYWSIREIVDAISMAEREIKPQYKQTGNVFREVAKNLDALCFERNMANGKPAILMFVKPLLRLMLKKIF